MMGDIRVKLVIQHNGNVIGTPIKGYVVGEVKIFPNVDVDKLRIPEMKYMVKETRITTHKFSTSGFPI